MTRLFVAVTMPEVVKQALLAIREDLRGFHWVEAANLHLTLKFIGDVDSELQEEIARVLSQVATEPFILPVETVGAFPSRGRPFVVWAGLGSAHPRLFGLQKEIEDRLFGIGIEPEKHRYVPHITLARCKEASEESVRQFVKRHRDFSAPPFRVEGFRLFSSILRQGSSVYTEEDGWDFNRTIEEKAKF